ncbi:DUF1304 family protein [Arthrobacter sp. NPDC089319]|uniref:DUF1304 family protein n=1 Tax=Arthrobacter sp. NPDC089319 TaxID=3155915 RepID=UPI0034140FE6
MTGVAYLLAVIFGLVLIAVGIAEAFYFRDPRFHKLFLIRPQDVAAVRLWTINLGFYNMLWGLVLIAGVFIAAGGRTAIGETMIVFTCITHVILGAVLWFTERRLWQSALAQAILPLIVLLLLFLF